MSDTPRTDHEEAIDNGDTKPLLNAMRQLERELNAANSKLSTVFQWINRNHPDGFIDSQSHLQNLERITDLHHDRLDAAQREQAKWQAIAEQLAEALTFWDVNHPALAAYESAKSGDLHDPPLFEYRGKMYMRPCDRGVVLEDINKQFDNDVLPEGDFVCEIRVWKGEQP